MAGQGNSHSPGRFAFKPALPPFLTSSLSCRQPPKLLIPGPAIISTTNILCLFGADSTKRLGGTDLSPLTSLCNAEPVRAAESLGSAYFTPQKASCPRQHPLSSLSITSLLITSFHNTQHRSMIKGISPCLELALTGFLNSQTPTHLNPAT